MPSPASDWISHEPDDPNVAHSLVPKTGASTDSARGSGKLIEMDNAGELSGEGRIRTYEKGGATPVGVLPGKPTRHVKQVEIKKHKPRDSRARFDIEMPVRMHKQLGDYSTDKNVVDDHISRDGSC